MKHFKEGRHRAAYAYYHGIKVKDFPKDEQGRSYEVHHINMNRADNSKGNLMLLSVRDHYDIHYAHGHFGACVKIAKRLRFNKEEHSDLMRKWHLMIKEDPLKYAHFIDGCRKGGKACIDSGNHNFNTKHSIALAQKRLVKGTHNFITNHPNKSRVMSVEDGKITTKSARHYHERSTGYVHTWIDL